MSSRVDPDLISELKLYGDINVEACFNCGNCTAICPLTTDETPFPRNNIRYLQLGLKDHILQNPDPWLCYYCGDCTATCPRGAEPAETQMAMRRWLTAQYDWTGLARLFYTSKFWEIGSMILVGAVVVLLFALFHGPVVTDHVELNTFAPINVIHIGDVTMAVVLLFFLLTNAYRMHVFIRRGAEVKPPFLLYITEAWDLVYQFVTQERWSSCDHRRPWIIHLFMVSGYVLMLVMIMFFLPWFQTDRIYPLYHPQRWLGYYATIVLLIGAGSAVWGRIKKNREMYRFSHLSDWIFPILLIAGAVTGILIHAFRYLGWPLSTYYMYTFHLAIMVPMLVLEVPFGKWSHLAYRPLAIYFERVNEKAKQQEMTPNLAPSGAD